MTPIKQVTAFDDLKPVVQLMASDTQARRQSGSIADVMATAADDSMVADYMLHSFYLPTEIIRDRRYIVKPVRVISGEEFAVLAKQLELHHEESTEPEITLGYEGCTAEMCKNAKLVGISERLSIKSEQTRLIAKIWYGKAPPFPGA